MTVATDLATAAGKRRRFYLWIDGYEKAIWQPDPADATGDDPKIVKDSADFAFSIVEGDEIRKSTDGSTWGAENSSGTEDGNDIHGTSSSNVWASCDLGVIHQWDGTSWTKHTIGGASHLDSIHVVSATDVWACDAGTGAGNGAGTVWRYDGSSWTDQNAPGIDTYHGIWLSNSRTVTTCGRTQVGAKDRGRIMQFDGATWTTPVSLATDDTAFTCVWGSDVDNIWVGGGSGPWLNGLVYHYNGTAWSDKTANLPVSTVMIWDATGIDENNVWMCGQDTSDSNKGVVFYYNGTDWTEVYRDASANTPLYSINAARTDSVLTAGASGRIAKWDGTSWATQTSGTANTLDGIWHLDVEDNGWSREGLACLRLPETEWSQELDLGEMSSQWSAMEFVFDNIEDPDDSGKFLFAKLFAPGRIFAGSTKRTFLVRKDVTDEWLDAGATTIYVEKTDGYTNMPSSGTAYMGQVTFDYTGKADASQTNMDVIGLTNRTIGSFTGVTMGKFPFVSEPRGTGTTTMGRHAFYSLKLEGADNDPGDEFIVADVPGTFLGRRVGLYVTTFDEATQKWNTEANSTLVWAGKISDSISYDPAINGWRVQCESMLAALERQQIAWNLPEAEIAHINISGEFIPQVIFQVLVHATAGGTGVGLSGAEFFAQITIAKGLYSVRGLVTAINNELADKDNWTGASAPSRPRLTIVELETGNLGIRVTPQPGWLIDSPVDIRVTSLAQAQGDWSYGLHAMFPLGFDQQQEWNLTDKFTTSTSGSLVCPAARPYFHAFHALNPALNGGVMYCIADRPSSMWDQQDTEILGVSFFRAKDASLVDGDKKFTAYFANASASVSNAARTVIGEGTVEGITKITLLPTTSDLTEQTPLVPGDLFRWGYLGAVLGESVKIGQIFNPLTKDTATLSEDRGPFYYLLYSLLSTGDNNYNDSAYDTLRPDLSVGMPIAIVDAQSFLDADEMALQYGSLASRRDLFFDKPTTWMDWFRQEAKLFGVTLVWANGKLTCRQVFSPELQDALETINDTNSWASDDMPVVRTSVDSVINRFKFKVGYDHQDGKFYNEIDIIDAYSTASLDMDKVVTVENRGVSSYRASRQIIKAILHRVLDNRMLMLRQPWQVIQRTLSPVLFNKIFVGDVVNISHTFGHPDPFGSGAMTASGVALVLDVSWNLREMKGNCTLMVWSRFASGRVAPWAPSAAVDDTATNAGWTHATQALILKQNEFGRTTDTNHDGEAFAGGDKLVIIERNPSNPASVEKYSVTVHGDGYDSATRTLKLTGANLSGRNDDGAVQYIVTFDDYGNSPTADQKTRGIWAADNTTQLIGGADEAYRWG